MSNFLRQIPDNNRMYDVHIDGMRFGFIWFDGGYWTAWAPEHPASSEMTQIDGQWTDKLDAAKAVRAEHEAMQQEVAKDYALEVGI